MTDSATIGKVTKVLCSVSCISSAEKPDMACLNKVFSRLESPSILGANSSREQTDRFSYWAAKPKEIFEFNASRQQPFEKLEQILNKYRLGRRDAGLPGKCFCGGWIGFFSYELGRYIEKIPQSANDDLAMPLIRLCFYDKVICYDHIEQKYWLIALECSDDTESIDAKFDWLKKLLIQASDTKLNELAEADFDAIDFSSISCNMDKEYYLNALARIRKYIFDGQIYQVNFSQRFECDFSAEAVELFNWQNRFNPSPYAAYIDAGVHKIVSASPEMFLTVEDGIICTKPIKGTRRRVADIGKGIEINKANFDDLVRSKKDQAELNMIIDLERNDLVRICQYGTRKVTQPRTIKTYPTVFHAVAAVEGKLYKDVTFCDIIKAMFPGGSITGAPKVAAMEIIDETEPTARGVYTGSIGYIGIDGSVCLNIAIRTIIIKAGKAYAQTGGGIVADSEAGAEWDETITKARALLAGINSVQKMQKADYGKGDSKR